MSKYSTNMRVYSGFKTEMEELKDRLGAKDLVETTRHVANVLRDNKSVVVRKKLSKRKEVLSFEFGDSRLRF